MWTSDCMSEIDLKMDKGRKSSSPVQSQDHKHPRRQRKEHAKLHTASSPHHMLHGSHVSDQSLRRNLSGVSPTLTANGVPARKRDGPRRFNDSETLNNNSHSLAQSRVMGKNSLAPQKKGFRDAQSAPNSAGKPKPGLEHLVPFEVKLNDFPELALGKEDPSFVQKACWGHPSSSPSTQTSAFSWKTGRRRSPTQRDPQQMAPKAKPDSSIASPGENAVISWANIASQPPKKPVPKEKSVNTNQTKETAVQQDNGAPGKKKRKKRKKAAKVVGEDENAESEGPTGYREPPKFEDEEEFPGLTLASTVNDRLMTSSNAAKLCNEETEKEGVQHHSADQTKENSSAAKTQSVEMAKKGQKAQKVSGKKSKVPVQLDIGNMLATLEKKQQSQKAKQDAKPVILSVGGGLPVVHKQPLVQKKPPWQQDKIAHNPLDSTSPLVKKGKQREVPKAKKPTPLKKVILKEREERKQRRLLEERGLLPEHDLQPVIDAAEEEQCNTNATDELRSPAEELDDLLALNTTNQMVKDDEEADKDKTLEQQTTSLVPCPANRPKIHSRKFRDYCSQMLSKDVDDCVTALLKELVRFQDRLYQKDPMKARMKRRIVMGLREVLKHLKLRKVKCVVISPNCERIQSKGGLDEALYTIIDTCREQGVPFVFALSRKALGHCLNKAVPVSLVGIFNYDGAQDIYHKMIELSSEARRAYEVMLSNLEQNTDEELAEKAKPSPEHIQSEDPEYIKIWEKNLEDCTTHKLLNFEEQLRSLCLESECIKNTDEDEKS